MKRANRQTTNRLFSDALVEIRRVERRMSAGTPGACRITPAQGALVHEIALVGEEGATAAGLAARLGISSPAVTQLVDGLVGEDVLRREHDPDDRRRVRIRLTDNGQRLYDLFDEARLAQAAALLQPLSDEEAATLGRLLTKVTLAASAQQNRKGKEA
jgi:DNA-binding MarR family transcriptional regulator